MKHYIR